MNKLSFSTDVNGKNTYGIAFAEYRRAVNLSTDNEVTLTLPTDNTRGYEIVFSYTGSVWVGTGSVAITLPGASFSDTRAELRPQTRRVPAGTILRFITGDTNAEVGVTAYAL